MSALYIVVVKKEKNEENISPVLLLLGVLVFTARQMLMAVPMGQRRDRPQEEEEEKQVFICIYFKAILVYIICRPAAGEWDFLFLIFMCDAFICHYCVTWYSANSFKDVTRRVEMGRNLNSF